MNTMLRIYCSDCNYERVKEILEDSNGTIDILEKGHLYEYSTYLSNAASSDYPKSEVVQILCDYYYKWNVNNKEVGSDEYLSAKDLLVQDITKILDTTHNIPSKIKQTFEKYISDDYDKNSDCGLDDLCDLNGIELESELCSEIDKKYLFKLHIEGELKTDTTDSASDSSFLSGDTSEVEA